MPESRGMAYGLVMAVAMNFFSYFFSEKMALMSARAQRVSETQYPEIYTRLKPIVGTLAQRMGIPMPKLWVTPDHVAQRFRHRAEPDTRFGGSDIGDTATDEGRRTSRGAGARIGARQE